MQAELGDLTVSVEVKAPCRELPPTGSLTWGDEADKIGQCVKKADEQFSTGQPNLLVIAPILPMPMFQDRGDLVKAMFGESEIVFPVFRADGTAVVDPPTRTEFRQTGKFLRTKHASGRPLKPSGLPDYRRISAVLCIEETLEDKYGHPFPFVWAHLDDETLKENWPIVQRKYKRWESRENETYVTHKAMVLHNPHAHHPIQEDVWDECPQLVPREGVMTWTDGYDSRM